ncbi:hypothetical protein [Flavobacterium suncheonense]|nr:hypothetical protein [Flavobacterium suncheonense]
MKKVFLLITTTLFLMSCTDENDSQNIANTQNSVLLQSTIETVGDDVSTRLYDYDGNKIVSETWEAASFTYEYTGDLITKITFQVADEPNPRYEQLFTYDGSNRLSQAVQLYYYNTTAVKFVFTHNADNTVSFDRYSGDFSSQDTFERSGKYFFNNNNEVSKIEEYVGESPIKIEYIYDTQNSPYKNVTGYDKLFFLNVGKKNNVVLTKLSNPYQNDLGDWDYEVVEIPSEFQYDGNNFPTDALVTYPENSGSSVDSKTVQYFYE